VQSSEGGSGLTGGDDADTLAQKAMLWYGRGTNTNPYDCYNYLKFGQCLDYLGRTNEALPYFLRADELDPNGYFTSALVGWHYREIGDFAACRAWSERSLRLERTNNPAEVNLRIANDRLLENAMRPDPAKR
jgi:tetratricopeptide (TPR) repeat protein